MGIEQTDTKQLQFKEGHIDDVGIRKAVLLVYYPPADAVTIAIP